MYLRGHYPGGAPGPDDLSEQMWVAPIIVGVFGANRDRLVDFSGLVGDGEGLSCDGWERNSSGFSGLAFITLGHGGFFRNPCEHTGTRAGCCKQKGGQKGK